MQRVCSYKQKLALLSEQNRTEQSRAERLPLFDIAINKMGRNGMEWRALYAYLNLLFSTSY